MLERLLRYGLLATPFAFVVSATAAFTGRHNTASYTISAGILCVVAAGTCLRAARVVPRVRTAARRTESRAGTSEPVLTACIVDASPLAILALDLQGRVTAWNRAAVDLFGWKAEEVMGRFLPTLPEDGKDQFDEVFARVRNGETIRGLEWLRHRRNGSCVEVAMWLAPVRGANGQVIGGVAEVMDITEDKRARVQLENSRASLERAHRMAALGSWDNDLRTGQSVWSDEVFRIFGVLRESIRPCLESYLAFVHPDDRARVVASRADAVKTSPTFHCDHRIVRPDGTVRYVRQSAEVVTNRDGKPCRLTGTMQDITEYKTLQEQLWQAQKLETVGRLAGGIAHDFNNLLTVINGYSELLLRRTTSDAVSRQGLSEILAAGERAAEMTSKLLAFSRKQMLEPRPVDLNAVVREMESILARLIGGDIILVTDLDPSLRSVHADPVQVQQIFLNTAVNARDAMPEGGVLRIETMNVESPAVLPDALRGSSRDYVLLSISDTGTGMTLDAREHIFEPFFTTKEPGKGTGLGLSTVYGIVGQSHGYISVDTAPGKGTTFRIYLPATEQILRNQSKPLAKRYDVPARILLADDNAEVREWVGSTLRGLGYDVVEAETGRVALELARREDHLLDLVITDVVMPGMNGFELAREVRRFNDSVPFIFVSGHLSAPDPGMPNECKGCFLPKPFTPEALVHAVRGQLGEEPSAVRS